jgi:phosphate starvation-inducible PhoH-like protein
MDFKNAAQRIAWGAFQQHDILFLIGPAGTGKTHLSMAFAIYEILQRQKKQIVLTRPIVEAGESLGYLPGDFAEKVNPYMLPLLDSMKKLVGTQGPQHDLIASSVEIAPLAYMRGRSFSNSICIFDEAQNATFNQLKLFLTRIDDNSKIIITGDPQQTDLGEGSGLLDVLHRVDGIPGVGVVKFEKDSIVRHPLVALILEKLDS